MGRNYEPADSGIGDFRRAPVRIPRLEAPLAKKRLHVLIGSPLTIYRKGGLATRFPGTSGWSHLTPPSHRSSIPADGKIHPEVPMHRMQPLSCIQLCAASMLLDVRYGLELPMHLVHQAQAEACCRNRPPPPSPRHPPDETSGPELPIDRTQWLAGSCTLPSSGAGRRIG